METTDGDIELQLLTTPIICEPITAQPIALCANSYEHLSDLRLADSSDGKTAMEVDLLIGSDYYQHRKGFPDGFCFPK
jgi:UDP-glucose 6-dehydrogenase